MEITKLKLFENKKINIIQKYYYLMHILTSNQEIDCINGFVLYFFHFLQMTTFYFYSQITTFDPNKNFSDKILYTIHKIVRIVGFFKNRYKDFKFLIYINFIILLFFIVYFIIILIRIKKTSIITKEIYVLNYLIKFFIYILFIVNLDTFSIQICFGKENNIYINKIKCDQSNNKLIFIITCFNCFSSILIHIFLSFFYSDGFFISSNIESKISCNYDRYYIILEIIQSITLKLYKDFHKGNFYLINIGYSIFLFLYFKTRLVYYDKHICIFEGIKLLLVIWNGIISFIFSFINIEEKGLIIIITNLLLTIVYIIYFNNFINKLLLEIPYYKISNNFYLLFYLKILYQKIIYLEENLENKNLLVGIIQMHSIECPNSKCASKTNDELYLPKTNEWSDRKKPFIYDKVFLNYFVVIVMNYFLSLNTYKPDLLINLVYYYLNEIGNICIALFYFKKLKESNLNFQEKFSLIRLKFEIKKFLVEKLNKKNENCFNLEELNTSYLFEYEDYAEKFIHEIYDELDLNIEFWKSFSIENKKFLNFNKIFKNVNKILKKKKKIKFLWKKMFKIYSGINIYYNFYLDYISIIDDNNFLKIEFENYKQKKENSVENIQQNFYNILFNESTGIVIVNGEEKKEGKIIKCNEQFGKIFKYDFNKMKDLNISDLMPKIFSTKHSDFMKNYTNIGEKKIIDIKEFKTFCIDRNNHLFMIKKCIKIFPILNKNLFFIGMICPEKIDDIILVDNNFIIQGISSKLLDIFQIYNNEIFVEHEIPFYVICKQFINFYKIFLKGNKQNFYAKSFETFNNNNNNNINETSELNSESQNYNDEDEKEKKKDENNNNNKNKNNDEKNNNNIIENNNINNNENDNININENIELEYEIKIPKFFEKLSKNNNFIASEFEYSSNFNNDNNNNKEEIIIIEEEKETLISNSIPYKKSLKSENINKIHSKFAPKFSFKNQNTSSSNSSLNRNTKEEEVKEAIKRLNKYKKYFREEKFTDIEKLFDEDTQYESTVEFKFNFTFEKYNFNNNYAYLIRCIDNKNDYDVNDNIIENLDYKNEEKVSKIISQKLKYFNKYFELNIKEQNQFDLNVKNIYKIESENDNLNILIKNSIEDIKNYSRIIGKKTGEIEEDENSSQSSLSGFESDLSKLNRIQEIRENISKMNIDSKSLIYIRIIPFLFFISILLFSLFFIKKFYDTQKFFYKLNEFNEMLFLIIEYGLEACNYFLDGYFIYYFRLNNLNYSISNPIGNEYEYFDWLKDTVTNLLEKTNKMLGIFIKDCKKFLSHPKYAWMKVNVSYYNEISLNDKEYLTLYVAEAFLGIYSFFNNNNINLNKILNISNSNNYDLINEIYYIKYSSIDNLRNNVLIEIINLMPFFTSTYKTVHDTHKNKFLLYIILILILCCIFSLLYLFLVIKKTSKMNEGFEKVMKISQEQIEENIKRIKNFKNFYVKKFNKKKSNNFSTLQTTVNNENFENNIIKKTLSEQRYRKVEKNISLNSDFELEKKPILLNLTKKLIIQYLLCFIVIILSLINLLFIVSNFTNNNNDLILTKNYLIKNVLFYVVSIFEIKQTLTYSKKTLTLEIGNLFDSEIERIFYKTLKKNDKLNDFYYKMFINDCCATLYDLDDLSYKECISKNLSISINNTNAFIIYGYKLVQEIGEELKYNLYVNNNNYILYNLLNSTNFLNMEIIYKFYIVGVIERIIYFCQESYKDSEIYAFNLICVICALFTILMGLNFIYVAFFFVPSLEKNIYTSRSFILIIPSVYILYTKDLEMWIEKLDNIKS